ncbi:hypothetical protein NLJ89_g7934 [Agrocybe chaxingu]|uniref:Uncharacterized protein n=1 Tax=Agrocybe chaxingu TaxID=84603 RepID=A0A9W8JVP9_9AGAR|nr:hypothetical protein NLJ89_g7934 [Agrocybe chaxingu]
MASDNTSQAWGAEIPSLVSTGAHSERLMINTWCTILLGFYSSPEDVKKTLVQCLDWYKNRDGLQHEFLVLKVRQTGKSEPAVLRFERRPSQDQVLTKKFAVGPDIDEETPTSDVTKAMLKDLRAEQRVLRVAGLTKMQKITDKKLNCIQAYDTITRTRDASGQLADCKEAASLVESYTFDGTLTLRDFVLAASSVSTSSERYLLFLQQCYWFCRTTVQVVLSNYNPKTSRRGEAFDRRGSYTVKDVPFQVNKDNAREVEKISDIFKNNLEKNNELINEKFIEGAGGKAMEKERADQEEKLRKKAEKDAQDAVKMSTDLAEKNRQLEEQLRQLTREVVAARIRD